MAGIRAALRWGCVAVAVCLLFLGYSGRVLAQGEEAEALIDAEAAEAQAIAMAGEFAFEAEAATAVDLSPMLGTFTTEADEAVADSSEVSSPAFRFPLGDFNPLLAIASALVRRGVTVTFVANPFYETRAKSTGRADSSALEII